MMVRIRTRLALLLLVLAISTPAITAQQPAGGAQQAAFVAGAQSAPLNSVVPVDPRIATGKLPNGLRYYVRANKAPRNRAELRLVVNAGSLLEDEDQRGLAHFVEHMSFNGTARFPKQDVVTFMQAIGMRFGAHVNAHTSFDETVYQLQIPTDNPVVIDRSLLIMEDWAHNVTFDPVEIDKERGVILEEWRLGLGAGARMQDKQFPVLLKGSRYADRLPIGRPETLRSFPYDRLKKFYTDWYRPDLMAVIAVGDFDPAVIEGLIKSHFTGIPGSASPRPRPTFNVPDQPSTLYSVATDPEATATTVSVYSKMAFRDQSTIGAYRQSLVERLFGGMLSDRLSELAEKPDPPFLAAASSRGLFVRSAEATSLNALVTEDGIERGLTELFTESDRVVRFGFTASELDRQKLNMKRGLEQAMGDEDAHTSEALADEYIRNFAQAEPIPGIPYEYGLYQRFLPAITLAEVNAVAKNWVSDRNRVVLVSAPQRNGVTMPDEARLAAAIKAASGKALTAYVDSVSALPLLDPLPAPGKIAKATTKDTLGITEWELSNGVRVVLKPTTFKQDEILFRAMSPGGTSLAGDQDFVAAETASEVISRSGLGKLTDSNLEKLLAGKTVGVVPDIGDMSEGLRGGSNRKDLETMFQLIYLTFTQPRADPEAFRTMTGQLTATLANRQALPEAAFNDALEEAVSQGHLRARPLSTSLLPQMNLDKSFAFYKDRFADASDFTFVFVGSFDADTMKPLVERYLASLPAINRREVPKDVGIRPPAGVVERQVVKGVDPKSEVGVVFTGALQNDQMHRVVMTAMAETLEGNLQRTLREDLGGTYGVSVKADFDKRPQETYRVTITFGCDPARMEGLVRTLFQMIEQFKSTGPSNAQVGDARSALARDLETNSRDNRYLLSQLAFKYEYNEDPRDVFNMREFYDQLNAATIRDAARMYLNTNRYVKVTLTPAGK
jgi:zinc protease